MKHSICAECARGYGISAGATGEAAVCAACPEGTFSPGGSNASCQACTTYTTADASQCYSERPAGAVPALRASYCACADKTDAASAVLLLGCPCTDLAAGRPAFLIAGDPTTFVAFDASSGSGDTGARLVRLRGDDAQCLVDPSSSIQDPACWLLGAADAAAQLASMYPSGRRRLLQGGSARVSRTLTCGSEHRQHFGTSGYDVQNGWCSPALTYLSSSEQALLACTCAPPATMLRPSDGCLARQAPQPCCHSIANLSLPAAPACSAHTTVRGASCCHRPNRPEQHQPVQHGSTTVASPCSYDPCDRWREAPVEQCTEPGCHNRGDHVCSAVGDHQRPAGPGSCSASLPAPPLWLRGAADQHLGRDQHHGAAGAGGQAASNRAERQPGPTAAARLPPHCRQHCLGRHALDK